MSKDGDCLILQGLEHPQRRPTPWPEKFTIPFPNQKALSEFMQKIGHCDDITKAIMIMRARLNAEKIRLIPRPNRGHKTHVADIIFKYGKGHNIKMKNLYIEESDPKSKVFAQLPDKTLFKLDDFGVDSLLYEYTKLTIKEDNSPIIKHLGIKFEAPFKLKIRGNKLVVINKTDFKEASIDFKDKKQVMDFVDKLKDSNDVDKAIMLAQELERTAYENIVPQQAKDMGPQKFARVLYNKYNKLSDNY